MESRHLEHPPMEQFPVLDDSLVVGGVPLTQLAQLAGRTPFYVYDRSLITARVAHVRAHLPAAVQLHYAIKANPMPALVCHLAGLVDGLDVASGRELLTAIATGMPPREISFAGPGKTTAELAQAVAADILINVESFREVRALADLSVATGSAARVAVRVNPDFELKSSGMKMGGGPKQFGVDAADVPALLEEIGRANLRFEGFHIYSGSQNLRSESICEAQDKSVQLALHLSDHAPVAPRVINIGGGFGIPYFPGDQPLDLVPIGIQLETLVERTTQALPGAALVVELGRYLVGESGLYICRVIDRKVSRGQVFLITDGGLHHHLAASGNFGQVLRKNYPVVVGNHVIGTAREKASVVGSLCTPLDLLADRMELARADVGDLIAIYQSGAYGLTASPAAFLSHPEPVELFV